MLDDAGQVVRTFDHAAAAARALGVHASRVDAACRSRGRVGGAPVRFADDAAWRMPLPTAQAMLAPAREVCELDTDGRPLRRFRSASAAAADVGVSVQAFHTASREGRPWQYRRRLWCWSEILSTQGEPVAVKNDHSRRARPVDAIDAAGQIHRCAALYKANALTNISPPKIARAIESGETIHARGSEVAWKFRWSPDTGEKPAPAGKLQIHTPVAKSSVPIMQGSVPVAEAPSLAGALSALASMAAGFGGLQLSGVSIVAGNGTLEVKIEKLEVIGRG